MKAAGIEPALPHQVEEGRIRAHAIGENDRPRRQPAGQFAQQQGGQFGLASAGLLRE
jgi:hypothetical protein